MYKFYFFLLALLAFTDYSFSQCEVFDADDQIVTEPFWYACEGIDYTLEITSPNDWSSYSIDWGDGSFLETGSNWMAGSALSHFYAVTTQNFNITITDLDQNCSITGTFVMEEPTIPSFFILPETPEAGCSPMLTTFRNVSPLTSENTVFTWNFGDGSPEVTLDYTSLAQDIDHTYFSDPTSCSNQVNFNAENFCNTRVNGGPANTFFDSVFVYDTDSASISASEQTLCFPVNEVVFSNSTVTNCEAEGNNSAKFEYWNFGDYFGTGQDSIIGWTESSTVSPYTIQFPGNLGDVYEVMLIDSGFCGIDTAMISIPVTDVATTNLAISFDEICLGFVINPAAGVSGNPTTFSWNFGEGEGWFEGTNPNSYTYSSSGVYTIQNAVGVNNSPSCADTSSTTITVLDPPLLNLNASNTIGCDSLEVSFTEDGGSASSWEWDLGNGSTFTGNTPPDQNYIPGTYEVSVSTINEEECVGTATQTITVFDSPTVDFTFEVSCPSNLFQFTNLSTTSDPSDPILSWFWDFGNLSSSNAQNPELSFNQAGTYDVTLTANTANCSSSKTISVTVEQDVTANFSASSVTGCSPLFISFTNNSVGADSYEWDFGNGSEVSNLEDVDQTFSNTSDTEQTYNVQLTATSATTGCSSTLETSVTISPEIDFSFDLSGQNGCSPVTVEMPLVENATSYSWNFGDGSDISNETQPIHTFENQTDEPLTYTVTLSAASVFGCSESNFQEITIYPINYATESSDGAIPGLTQFFEDSDEDSFGNEDSILYACLQPEGYVLNSDDCDDTDASINPNAEESCSGADDNCNGEIDEGFTTIELFEDTDNDGFGNPNVSILGCSAPIPSGFSTNNLDCDDTNENINPDSEEVCNNADDNCNDEIDEGFTLTEFFLDSDQDGFGDANSSVFACIIPDGYTTDNQDCDDSNQNINPDSEEVCNNADDNCNDEIDEGLTFIEYFLDSDQDGFGDANASISACSPPEGYVTDNQDCDDTNENINPDSEEVCNNADDNCNDEIDEGFTIIQYFLDNDEDGFGDPDNSIMSCDTPDGYVTDNQDCDDTDADINPDSEEVCNNADDNCNDEIDEGFTIIEYFLDSDEDGFGDPDTSIMSCDMPEGYVADNQDCDDTDADINPDAEEILDDDIDQNCDGILDTGIEEIVNPLFTFTIANSHEGLLISRESHANVNYTFYDLTGNLISDGTLIGSNGVITTSSFAAGIYMIKLYDDEFEFVKKVMVE